MHDKKNVPLIFFILIMLFASLVVLIILPRNISTNRLQKTVSHVLLQKENGRYEVGQRVYFKTSLSDSTYFFRYNEVHPELGYSVPVEGCYVVLTRITGLNGPVSVVYYGSADHLEYAGIAGIQDSQTSIVQYGLTDTMIFFWKDNLCKVLSRGENEERK